MSRAGTRNDRALRVPVLGRYVPCSSEPAVIPEQSGLRRRVLVVRAAYIAIVLVATLADLHFSPNIEAARYRLARAFVASLGWHDAIDALRNVVLFAGLGGVWLLSPDDRTTDDVRDATIVGLLLSVAIEGLQIFSPIRQASIIDVLTDTTGALAGALTVAGALELLKRQAAHRTRLGLSALLVAGPYLLAILAEALTPLFQSDPLNIGGGPLNRLSLTLSLSSALSWAAVPVSDAPLFLAAGFLWVVLAREQGWRVSDGWTVHAGVGSLIIVAVHLAHGVAGLPIHWEAIGIDTAALTIGAWAAARPARIPMRFWKCSDRTLATMGVYAGLLIVWGWRPFEVELNRHDIAGELAADHWVPLRALAERIDLFSVAHTAQQFLLYVPLGALLATRSASRRDRSLLWAALVLVAAIEFGHVFVALRTFDITNALLAWAGLAAGWRIARCAGCTRADLLPPRVPACRPVVGSPGVCRE